MLSHGQWPACSKESLCPKADATHGGFTTSPVQWWEGRNSRETPAELSHLLICNSFKMCLPHSHKEELPNTLGSSCRLCCLGNRRGLMAGRLILNILQPPSGTRVVSVSIACQWKEHVYKNSVALSITDHETQSLWTCTWLKIVKIAHTPHSALSGKQGSPACGRTSEPAVWSYTLLKYFVSKANSPFFDFVQWLLTIIGECSG